MHKVPGMRYVPDVASIGGVLVGFAAVIGGLLLEGGKVADIAQLTGAIIVFGGTLGAVMITTPVANLLRAAAQIRLVFFEPKYSKSALISEIIRLANIARKNGIVSLESDVDHVHDPFFRKALSLGVDGTDLEALRKMMELELDVEADRGRADSKVFETAGGYAPTIGIIGAVLGLIQVMKHLENIDAVGHGIAVAFVATVYGVGSANLLFLPAAAKIRSRMEQSLRVRELMLEGVCSIVQGLHPSLIERQLEAYGRDGMESTPVKPHRTISTEEKRAAA
jgi:chemotaxis protein MotA